MLSRTFRGRNQKGCVNYFTLAALVPSIVALLSHPSSLVTNVTSKPRASMMTKGIIAVAAAFMFALTVGILTAGMAESGNDRASNPTIRTLALQY